MRERLGMEPLDELRLPSLPSLPRLPQPPIVRAANWMAGRRRAVRLMSGPSQRDRLAEEVAAQAIIDADARRRAEGEEIVHGIVEGGGKCKMAIGRTKDSLRQECGGKNNPDGDSEEVAAARAQLAAAAKRREFTGHLW